MKGRFTPSKIPFRKAMRRKSLAGFTLSELLLATAILVIALSGLLALFINCIFLNESNRNLALATSHAQYILEEIRGTAFNQAKDKITNGDWNLSVEGEEGKRPQDAPYNLTALSNENITTSITTNETQFDPLGVSVLVRWKDRGQRDRDTTLETLITDY